ncbi:MAG: FliM/FliN family flagellar motor switch protein [Solirubrobacteraceae bacterium]
MAEDPVAAQPGGAATATTGQPQDATPGGERRIRPLDFSQPNKFTNELRRRIAAGLGSFCKDLAERLCDELKCEVAIEVDDVEQHTWVAAKARLPADAPALAVMSGPVTQPEQQMLLSVELPWLLQSLECLLGGQSSQAPSERHLSDIDWALAEALLDSVVDELSDAWGDLGGGELRRGPVDLEGDAGLLTVASEPTLSVSISSVIGGCESGMTLLLPWPCVEPLADGLRAGADASPGRRANGAEELSRGVADARVLLRAEVGSVQMPIERMRAIVPGTLLELEQRADEGGRRFAEEVSLGCGRPGASGTRRALKLESVDEPPVRSQTYARLGRSDLQRARAEADEPAMGPGEEPILRSIFVRVWAELGRTHMSLGASLEMAPGSVVELDQAAQAPVELFANGLCFANGSLVVTAEGTWGVQVHALI